LKIVSTAISHLNYNTSINDVTWHLDALEKQKLQFAPWKTYPYHPQVGVAISYNVGCIFLKFYVDESAIKAANGSTNAAVYEDSCVEFFISFDASNYYNIEFNCIGACTIGYGKEKANRKLLPNEVIEQIRYQAVINNSNKSSGTVHWDLTLVIPSTVFIYDTLTTFKGNECTANFYKCGDLLPNPHYITWADIHSTEPNFHLPEFFGKLHFV